MSCITVWIWTILKAHVKKSWFPAGLHPEVVEAWETHPRDSHTTVYWTGHVTGFFICTSLFLATRQRVCPRSKAVSLIGGRLKPPNKPFVFISGHHQKNAG